MGTGRWGSRRVVLTATAVLVLVALATTAAVLHAQRRRVALESATAPADGQTSTTTTTTTAPPAVRAVVPRPPTSTSTSVAPLANRIAFVGDSLAVNLGEAARAHASAITPGIDVVSDGISGCGVARSGPYRLAGRQLGLSDICAAWSDEWAAALERDRPKVVVIQLGRHEVLDRQFDGDWSDILEPTYADYVRGELETAISEAGADGREVVLLTAPYFHSSSSDPPEDDPARVQRFNELLDEIASGRDHVHVIDLGGRASPDGEYADVVDGIRIRSDGVHYSAAGAAWAVKWLLPQLAPLAAQVPS